MFKGDKGMIIWGLLIICVFMSIFYSYWFLMIVALLGIWKVSRFWFYESKPWRRIHYPAIKLYSSIAGSEVAKAEMENIGFNFNHVLFSFIVSLRPDWDSNEVMSFIDREITRSKDFEDRGLIKKYFLEKNRNVSESQIDNALDEFWSKIDPPNRAWVIRVIVAGIIENQYGEKARGEYLYEVMVGNAK